MVSFHSALMRCFSLKNFLTFLASWGVIQILQLHLEMNSLPQWNTKRVMPQKVLQLKIWLRFDRGSKCQILGSLTDKTSNTLAFWASWAVNHTGRHTHTHTDIQEAATNTTHAHTRARTHMHTQSPLFSEERLGDAASPETLRGGIEREGRDAVFAYKRNAAKFAWPVNLK